MRMQDAKERSRLPDWSTFDKGKDERLEDRDPMVAVRTRR